MLVSPASLHAAVVDCWRSACIKSSGGIEKSLWKLTLFTGNYHEFQWVPGLVRLMPPLCARDFRQGRRRQGLRGRPPPSKPAEVFLDTFDDGDPDEALRLMRRRHLPGGSRRRGRRSEIPFRASGGVAPEHPSRRKRKAIAGLLTRDRLSEAEFQHQRRLTVLGRRMIIETSFHKRRPF